MLGMLNNEEATCESESNVINCIFTYNIQCGKSLVLYFLVNCA